MKKPKYPKKYRKITPQINKKIHEMYNAGYLQIEIARHFGLASSTITKTLHERSKITAYENSKLHNREYRKDPSYRSKINEAVRENVKKRYHTDKKYKKFLKEYSVVDKARRKEYLKKYYREYHKRKRKELQLFKRKTIITNTRTGLQRTNKTRKNGVKS